MGTTTWAIRRAVARYVRNVWSLVQFRDWLVEATLEESGDTELEALVAKIELAYAEYTSGHLDEDELRALLLQSATPLDQTTGSYTVTEQTGATLALRVTIPAAVFQAIHAGKESAAAPS